MNPILYSTTPFRSIFMLFTHFLPKDLYVINTGILDIKISMLKMKGLSETELGVVGRLEFDQKNYFTREDIAEHFDNKRQMINTVYRLKKKGRIIPLSKNKYFLVPVKAFEGKWTDHPLRVLDEMFNSKDYVIGGWYAAYLWGLTEQVPMQVDVFTTKRQGKIRLLNKRYVFHRTTQAKVNRGVVRTEGELTYRIISKEEAQKWIKKRI